MPRSPRTSPAAPVSPCYLLFYKPYDVLCQFTDQATTKRSTLKEFIPVPEVYPVGRLDQDSEGLVLLTNQGWAQHRISHPRFGHARTYWVQVEGCPTDGALEKLRGGVAVKDYVSRPCQVDWLSEEPSVPPRDPPIRFRKSIPTQWLALTLTEGRNRQVRRMTAAVGFPTLRLIRVSLRFGRTGAAQGKQRSLSPVKPTRIPELSLDLQGLQPGEWRYLSSQERQALEKCLR